MKRHTILFNAVAEQGNGTSAIAASVEPRKRSPRSMNVPQNEAATSTPAVIDYTEVVSKIAKVRTDIGAKFLGHKSKQSLFALACNAVKSLRGIENTAHLPEAEAVAIKNAVSEYWLGHARKIVDYGEVVSVQYDLPTARAIQVAGAGGAMIADVDVKWTATMKARRESKDRQEFRLALSFNITKAEKRLTYMNEHPEKGYTREDIRTHTAFLDLLKAKHAAVSLEIANATPAPTA